MPLPAFTEDGVLPEGDYCMSLADLQESLLITGDGSSSTWDAAWRRKLVENLAVLAQQLWDVGISDIFVDGSFVEDKDHPNDIDGYFHCELRDLVSGELIRRLNLLDPHKVWTWDSFERRPYRGSPRPQLPMWHVYRVELYPHVGQLCGIRDRWGYDQEFPSAFRQSRVGSRPKGIIRLRRGDT